MNDLAPGTAAIEFSFSPSEIDGLIAPYVQRRFAADSDEWRGLVAREARLRRVSYLAWRRRLFGWLASARALSRSVEKTYDQIWSGYDIDTLFAPAANATPLEWQDEGLVANAVVTQRVHLAAMVRIIRTLRPRRVLEVGSGRGINLLVLACLCPATEFHGLELTESGVAAAREFAAVPGLPPALVRFMPEAPLDPVAHRRLRFDRGSAASLPYKDGAFDLVMTRLALEQMEAIRPVALAEIARVAGAWTLMIEPFRDVNETGLRRDYLVGNNYFQGAIGELERFGLDPLLVFSHWPSKVTLKPALVLARRGGRAR